APESLITRRCKAECPGEEASPPPRTAARPERPPPSAPQPWVAPESPPPVAAARPEPSTVQPRIAPPVPERPVQAAPGARPAAVDQPRNVAERRLQERLGSEQFREFKQRFDILAKDLAKGGDGRGAPSSHTWYDRSAALAPNHTDIGRRDDTRFFQGGGVPPVSAQPGARPGSQAPPGTHSAPGGQPAR